MEQDLLGGELLTERMVAKHLRCKAKTLQRWRVKGGGPDYIKVGQLVRYDVASVHAWVQTRRRSSTSNQLTR